MHRAFRGALTRPGRDPRALGPSRRRVTALMWKYMFQPHGRHQRGARDAHHLDRERVARRALGGDHRGRLERRRRSSRLLVLAGLQVIPDELYESAKVGRRLGLATVLQSDPARWSNRPYWLPALLPQSWTCYGSTTCPPS